MLVQHTMRRGAAKLTEECEEPDGGADCEGARVVERRRVGVGVGHGLPAIDGDDGDGEGADQDVGA